MNSIDSNTELSKMEEDSIDLTKDKKLHIYSPWQFLVILKVFEGKLAHCYLKTKLDALWKLSKPLCIIDLGHCFFTEKFNGKDNHEIVLQHVPWFVAGNFISVRKWEPNFVPSTTNINSTMVWVWLPQLPTEFYD